jgi:hypothetical protein
VTSTSTGSSTSTVVVVQLLVLLASTTGNSVTMNCDCDYRNSVRKECHHHPGPGYKDVRGVPSSHDDIDVRNRAPVVMCEGPGHTLRAGGCRCAVCVAATGSPPTHYTDS